MVFIRAGPTSSSQETTLAVTLSAKHAFKCVLMKMKMHVAGGTIPSGRKCGKETSMAANIVSNIDGISTQWGDPFFIESSAVLLECLLS